MNNQISLHVTVEGKVFSVFSPTFDQAASRVVSMSASDKITQWQVLGFQGALLSHFTEPIYVSSILIGKSLNHRLHLNSLKSSVSQLQSYVAQWTARLCSISALTHLI